MTENDGPRIGFACAYAPLALIHAAGFAPYRILLTGDWPDQAGQMQTRLEAFTEMLSDGKKAP